MAINILTVSGQPAITGSSDDYGIATNVVSCHADTLTEAMVGQLPNPTGLPEVRGRRRWQEWVAGRGYLVWGTFEGITGEFSEDDLTQYDFDSSFEAKRLEAHPKIDQLVQKYGGVVQEDGTIYWPLKLPQKQSRGNGVSKSQAAAGEKNPLFGEDSYAELQAVFRITEVRRSIPSRLLTEIGTIVKSLPGGHPTPPNRDWLTMPFRTTKRGNVVQITRELLLGPHGGWPKDIYEFLVV
ncbi:MAG: hypothetical protein JNJ83_10940 [Verrucomicrobiaceae bacterium]|nr:hypothetical protein [Verrucomicrobiaceae bacterium]